MSARHLLFSGAALAALLLPLAGARAETAPAAGSTVSELVITGDPVGLLEKKPSNTVFGLDKPLIDTPRSASLISDVTIQRYGIQTIDDLIEIAPGTFTASFYGVAGSLNIRGTYAENYFE